MSRRPTGVLILSFFFFSGLSGLVYEVVWTRLLGLVMGHTVYSITTVLAAFMGGLGLGSYFGGRYVDRRGRAVLMYGILEGLIGLYCLLLPLLIQGVEPLFGYVYRNWYGSFYPFSLVRFLVCGLLLLIPTSLMGATLPILSKFFISDTRMVGFTIGRLYAINTFGAVAGSVLSGFVLIPTLGTWGTIAVAAVVNLAIATAVILFFRDARRPGASAQQEEVAESREEVRPTSEVPAGLFRLILVGFGLSGCAAMIYQVGWTRVLSLVIGSSTYAFTLMVTAFTCGLALGAAVLSRFVDRSRDLVRVLGLTNLVVAASAALVVPLFGELPLWMVDILNRYGDRFGLLIGIEFVVILSVMLVPTFVMGVMFPIVSRFTTTELSRVGRSIGTAYAANTVGAIVGAVAGGFLLVPFLGIWGALLVAVAINGLLGVLLVLVSPLGRSAGRRTVTAGAAAAVVLAAILLPPRWDQSLLLSGAYIYAPIFEENIADMKARGLPSDKIPDMRAMMATAFGRRIFLDEGANTTVTVHRMMGALSLQVNGKTDASTEDDMRSQKLLAHIPMLLHEGPQDVLVVGLASGVTAGGVTRYPVRRLDVVEISEAVSRATRLFDAHNYGVLDDPKMNLIIGDGRTHVALTDQTYDVIISEPSNPWIAGIGFLFTREYFEMCRDRLAPGGIAAIWLHMYQMKETEIRSIVRTFCEVFPEAYLFEMIVNADYLLVGSMDGISIPWDVFQERASAPRVAEDLSRILIKEGAGVIGLCMMGRPDLLRYAGEARIHTDNNSLIEFQAPRHLYVRDVPGRAFDLDRQRKSELPGFIDPGADKSLWLLIEEKLNAILRARHRSRQGIDEVFLEQHEEAERRFLEALEIYDHDVEARNYLLDSYIRQSEDAAEQGRIEDALEFAFRATQMDPRRPNSLLTYATALQAVGRYAEARESCLRALEVDPEIPEAYYELGVLSEFNEEGVRYGPGYDLEQAMSYYQRAIQILDDYPEAHCNLGYLLYEQGRIEESIAEFRRALELSPKEAMGYHNLGIVLKAAGYDREALEAWREFLSFEGIDPANQAAIRAQVQALELRYQ